MIKRVIINVLLIVLWTAMALVLFVAGALVCGVKILSPDKLTPIVANFANKALDAEVGIGRVELAFEPAFPVLKLKIDSVTIVSDALRSSDRAGLPPYADTLFTLDAFRGGIDLMPLFTRGEISVGDVTLVRPAMNIVFDRNGKANFDIYKAAEDTVTEETATVIPPFTISRFSFENPGDIRYFNEADSTEATVVMLSEASMAEAEKQRYSLKIDGRLGGPTAGMLNLENIGFGLDGKVHWSPEHYTMFALEDFTVYGAFVRAKADVSLAYDSTLTVSSGRLSLDPVALTDVLAAMPADMLNQYRLVKPFFTTDAAVAAEARLDRPFDMAADSIPFATIDLRIPKCSLRYGKADIRALEFDGTMTLRGNDPDSADVNIRKFIVSGPATSLDLSCSLSRLVSNPKFKAALRGRTDMRRLPPILSDLIPGTVSGILSFNLDAAGAASMFSAGNFHKLDVKGDLKGRDIYFVSSDTAKMLEIDGLDVRFDSRLQTKEAAPTLGAKINVDTATVLIDGVSITGGALAIGAGVENTGRNADTTLIVPIGGGVKIGNLNILSITDSAGVRIRNLLGRAGVQRYNGSKRLPVFSADFELGSVFAGTTNTRLMLRNAALHARTHMNPERARRRAEIKRLADSIKHVHPDLSPDSVYRLAVMKRHHRPGMPTVRRVSLAMTPQDNEMIEWDIAKGLRRYLLDWELEGEITTRRAAMLTPYFPLRSRISRLDIDFSTDTVAMRGVRCRVGRSDMTINGLISNIKRALTSRRRNNELKVDFVIESDTVDVNQIAAAAFAGSAYAEKLRKGSEGFRMTEDEAAMEKQLADMAAANADSVGAFLIPTNVEANLELTAKNVLYDDFLFRHFNSDILVYDGAVNLHDLSATSSAGDISLSALYSAPKASEIQLGVGLLLKDFRIDRFLHLVPAVDSIMPMMRSFSGIIDAEIAATVDVDSTMNMVLPTLDAAVRLSGDSLAFIDPKTYATMGKWLRFRDRADNKIKHANVELIVRDNMLQLFPFSFDIDSYRLGVLGYNDLAMNFDYHISVLKSPLPFKFGINIKGNPDKYKIRLGGAKYKQDMAAQKVDIVDTARVNLVRQIENVFRRGVQNSKLSPINVSAPDSRRLMADSVQAFTAADSLVLIREGFIDSPPAVDQEEPEKKSLKDKIMGVFGKKHKDGGSDMEKGAAVRRKEKEK